MTEELCTVELQRVPLALRALSAEHGDELAREFEYLDAGDDTVPKRLLALAAETRELYGGYVAAPTGRLAEAAEAGLDTVDSVFQVPASSAAVAARLIQLLDEADRYCREGSHLLTLATPPAAAAYRRWMLDEFVRQIAGEAPRPWSDELVDREVERLRPPPA